MGKKPRMALILHSHPELVHLRKVEQYEINGIINISVLSIQKSRFNIEKTVNLAMLELGLY